MESGRSLCSSRADESAGNLREEEPCGVAGRRRLSCSSYMALRPPPFCRPMARIYSRKCSEDGCDWRQPYLQGANVLPVWRRLRSMRYKADTLASALRRLCGEVAVATCSFSRSRRVEEGVDVSVSLLGACSPSKSGGTNGHNRLGGFSHETAKERMGRIALEADLILATAPNAASSCLTPWSPIPTATWRRVLIRQRTR